MFCRKCGKKLDQGNFCGFCGEVYTSPRPPAPPHRYDSVDQHAGEGLAIVSLVIGIIAMIIFLANWFVPFAEVLFGIPGIIFAMMAYGRGNKSGKATAGMILSILAVGMGGIYWCACMLLCSTMMF